MGKYVKFYNRNKNRMASTRKLAATTAICGVLSSCAVFPTPFGSYDGKNFQHDLTFDIVEKVRCEARDAMFLAFYNLMNSETEYQNWPRTAELQNALLNDQNTLKNFDIFSAHPLAQIRASFFDSSSIGLDFDLEITETNNHSFTPTLTASGGSHSLDLKISATTNNLTRKSKRLFYLPDLQFSSFRDVECRKDHDKYLATKQNNVDWQYPLRGNINIIKSVKGFIDFMTYSIRNSNDRNELAREAFEAGYVAAHGLSKPIKATNSFFEKYKELQTCSGPECERKRACYKAIIGHSLNFYNMALFNASQIVDKDTERFKDTLTFTTSVSTGANPTLTFSDAIGSFKFSALALNLSPKREDIHKLTISFVPPARYTLPVFETTPITIPIGKKAGYSLSVQLPNSDVTKPIQPTKECINPKSKPKKGRVNIASSSRRNFTPPDPMIDTSGPIPFRKLSQEEREENAISRQRGRAEDLLQQQFDLLQQSVNN